MGNAYIRPTAIKGLLSGEDQCQWAAWYKAHNGIYRQIKSDFDFEAWRKNHTRLVEEIADELRGLSYTVSVEQQNRFKVVGDAATVAGQIDIIAVPPKSDEGAPVMVIDAKTGKPYDKDRWQVRVYLAMAPLAWPDLKGLKLQGQVHYMEPRRSDPVDFTDVDRQRVFDQIKRSAGPEPSHSPSRMECRFCDIAECEKRYSEDVPEEASACGAF